MLTETLQVRLAGLNDAEEILGIYAPYVTDTAISFEYEVPSLAVFRKRMANTLSKYPFLVAEGRGEILGYAYTGAFIGRAAYAWSAETTIYLKSEYRRQGVGRKLYEKLESISQAQNILNLNACIGYPEAEDEYLTKNSVQFHRHLGYRTVGTFHNSGYKFSRWYNMVWMEKIIGQHNRSPAAVIAFPDLDSEILIRLGVRQ